MSVTAPDVPDRDPQVEIYETLRDDWNDDAIDGRFSTDWLHTGWYSGNPNPEISVTWQNEVVDSDTGYTGVAGSGGPTSRPRGTVNIDVWVTGDREQTGGVNPKQHAYQLRKEVRRIIEQYPNGPPDTQFTSLGVTGVRIVPDPEDTDIEHRHRVEVSYRTYRGRQ